MSRYLALDAEQGRVYLASANIKGSAVRLEKAVVLSDLGTLTADNAAEVGKRLKDAMREAGIAPGPVLFSVGRERVVLKEIRFPASVSAAEEPNVVRFQVSKELSESGDSVVIDYFAHPTPEPDGQKRALAFAVRKEILQAARVACAAAGLKMVGVTPRPFGVAASLLRAMKDGAVTPPDSPIAPIAVLVRGDKWGELVILREGQVAFSRSLTAMAVNSEAAMQGEIRRNLAVFAGQSEKSTVKALYVAEGEMPGGWSGRLQMGLNIPVQSFDPIAGADARIDPENRGSFAGLVGLIALRARNNEMPVNFLAPREPKEVGDPNKRLLLFVGLGVVVLFLAVMGFGFWTVQQKSKEATNLRKEKAELETEIAARGDTIKRATIVRDWEHKNVCWLDEIYDLVTVFPDPAGTEVVKLSGTPTDPPKGAVKKHVAALVLEVNTESERAVELLNAAIHDPYRETDATQRKGAIGERGVRKNLRYEVKARIEHREPNFYLLQLKATAPTRRERPRDETRSDLKGEPKSEIKTETGEDMKGGVGPVGGGQ